MSHKYWIRISLYLYSYDFESFLCEVVKNSSPYAQRDSACYLVLCLSGTIADEPRSDNHAEIWTVLKHVA